MHSDSNPDKCTQCSSCSAVCPVVRILPDEAASPRGRLYYLQVQQLLDDVERKELEPLFHKAIFCCTTCGQCEEVCSSGVEILEIWKAERAKAIQRGAFPRLQMLANTIEESKNIYGIDNEERTEILLDSLEDTIPQIEDRIYEPGMKAKTVFFLGCLESFRSGQLEKLRSQISLLERLNEDYILLGGEEYCCGHPLGLMGYEEKIRPYEKHHKELFDEIGAETIITNCPGCLISLRDRYNLSQKTLHFTEYLDQRITDVPGQLRIQLSYHAPCELENVLKIKDAPRNLLRKIGVDIKELEQYCCGGGGLLRAAYPELSTEIVKQKKACQQLTALATSCPSCQEQFCQNNIEAFDVVELVNQAFRGEKR
ncbi:MAG: (Fe-S)-binding protein [Candidatus Ranarchaeia archaeon]